MDINRHHLSTPVEIISTKLDIPQDYRQQCIKEIYNLGDSMNQETNVKAIMSSPFIWNETKILNPLIDKIMGTINKINPIFDERFVYQITNCWSAIYKKSNYTNPHTHTISQTSFIFYLKSNTNSSPLLFDDCNFHIQPNNNTLVVFPGYLKHSVPQHTDNEDRICLAGNLTIIESK